MSIGSALSFTLLASLTSHQKLPSHFWQSHLFWHFLLKSHYSLKGFVGLAAFFFLHLFSINVPTGHNGVSYGFCIVSTILYSLSPLFLLFLHTID
ncbi:hypothetical protein HOY82DRAFT_573957 [Tuber indicum]|nr:hypothetical protein HOY82DRAFT_573957 [Tuber indicum]